MPTYSVNVIANVKNSLGEGILWHPKRKWLFWFDIDRDLLFSSDYTGNGLERVSLGCKGSAAAWIDEHHLVLATAKGLIRYSIDNHTQELLVPFTHAHPGIRSNDARCDPWGRFWVSTMDIQAVRGQGCIYVISGNSLPDPVVSGLTVPNSIAFSPDRRQAYYADSPEQTIFVLDLDPDTGRILDHRVFTTVQESGILPDGSVVDAEGYLWNAQWDGWRLVRYRPDGTIERTVEVPVQRPTCPAFGGPDLSALYATSARTGLTDEQIGEQPHAGKVLAIRTEVPGIPEYAFVC